MLCRGREGGREGGSLSPPGLVRLFARVFLAFPSIVLVAIRYCPGPGISGFKACQSHGMRGGEKGFRRPPGAAPTFGLKRRVFDAKAPEGTEASINSAAVGLCVEGGWVRGGRRALVSSHGAHLSRSTYLPGPGVTKRASILPLSEVVLNEVGLGFTGLWGHGTSRVRRQWCSNSQSD